MNSTAVGKLIRTI